MNKAELDNLAFETKVIHAGHSFDPTTHALASPL